MKFPVPQFQILTLLLLIGLASTIIAALVIPGGYAVQLPLALLAFLAVYFGIDLHRHYKYPVPISIRAHWRLIASTLGIIVLSLFYLPIANFAFDHYRGQSELSSFRTKLTNVTSPGPLRVELLDLWTSVPTPLDGDRNDIDPGLLPDRLKMLLPNAQFALHNGLGVTYVVSNHGQAKTFLLFAANDPHDITDDFVQIIPGLGVRESP